MIIHSSGLSFPGALGVKNSLGQNADSRLRAWADEDPDEVRGDEGDSQGACPSIVSRIVSSQSRVACRSRSFHSPWPKMKAYGREGLVAGRRERRRSNSSEAMGKRIICSTALFDQELISRKRSEITLTHDIDGVGGTGNAIWIMFDDVGCLENSLDRAGFDIELVIAEAVLSRYPLSSAHY